jgi:Ca2+-binding EF-hand superfamily protein
LFDLDDQQGISFSNLKSIHSEIGVEVGDEELYEMFEEADRDSDGLIS